MDKAILVTGFNNWGKTRLIQALFGKKRFSPKKDHAPLNVKAMFAVEPYSNGDFGKKGFQKDLKKRLKKSPSNGENLLCAFCPSIEISNDSRAILGEPPLDQYAERHILLLIYKWDNQGKLREQEIRGNLAGVAKLTIHTISGRTLAARVTQATQVLQGIFP